MDAAAFITSLVTSMLIFIVLFILYLILSKRPGNYPVYYPLLLLKRQGTAEDVWFKSPFAWLREAWGASEHGLVSSAGLDAVVYINLFDAALKILGFTALFCLPVLVTVSALSDNYERESKKNELKSKSNETYNGFDKLAMGNIRNGSNKLWIFAIGAYWLSIVTYLVLWKKYQHIIKLRNAEQSAAKAKPEQFAVLVRDIPRTTSGNSRTEQVHGYFKKIYPDSYEKCIVVTKLDKAAKVWTVLETTKKKLARAEAVYAATKTKESSEGVRPMHKTGFLGLLGPKVDSIQLYRQQIVELSTNLEEEQIKARSAEESAAFVFFNSRTTAAAAGQCTHAPCAQTWKTILAPEPREVVWDNLHIPYHQRFIRSAGVYVIVFLTIFFYMIPIGAVSALTTLKNLQKLLPIIKPIVKIKILSTVLEAYLPQLALILFLALLPALLLFLSKLQGIPSQSHLVRAAAGKFFYFNVLNVFLGVTLSASLFDSFKAIEKNPNSAVKLLGASIPRAASFFITFIALKFFVGYGLELSRVVPLLIFHLKKKYLCKTEDDVKAAWEPSAFNYATNVPSDILILTIAMCYAVISPMVLPFAIAYFGIGWFLVRHKALKICAPSYESGGRMWPHIHSRIVEALLVSQVAMLGYFGIKGTVQFPVLLPLPLVTVVFKYVCSSMFYKSFAVVALEVVSAETKELPTVEAIVDAYTPTCLLTSTTGGADNDDKFEDARTNMSTSRTSSGITSPA